MSLRGNSISEQNSWDLSKENIQPLKSGRSILAATSSNEHLLKEQRQRFEEELRLNNGDDPLEVWYRYIKWTEQNFPSGKDNQLRNLVQKCLAALKDHKQYSNDFRWWYIWQKFAFLSSNVGSLGIYEFMYRSEQCTHLAAFFKQWAFELEQAEDYSKAADVYKKGIAEKAQPLDDLERQFLEFELRVGRKTMTQLSDESPNDDATRNFLGVLKGVGKKATAPVIRQSSIQEVKLPSKNLEKQTFTTVKDFTIFDENDDGKINVPQNVANNKCKEIKIDSISSESVKENFRKPGIWTKQKIKGTSSVRDAAEFRVFVDDNTLETNGKPTPVVTATGILKPIIKQEFPNPLRNVVSVAQEKRSTKNVECKEVPAYDENLVYGGVLEMSFEEMRALKYEPKKVSNASNSLDHSTNKCINKINDKISVVGEKPESPKFLRPLVPVSGRSVASSVPTSNKNVSINDHTKSTSSEAERRIVLGSAYQNVEKENRRIETKQLAKGLPSSAASLQPLTFAPGIVANTSFTSNIVRDAMAVFSNTLQLNSLGDSVNITQSTNENNTSEGLVVKDDSSVECSANSLQHPVVQVPSFHIYDENAKRPCLFQSSDDDKENLKPPGMIYQQPPKRQTSGILTPAVDIVTEPPAAEPVTVEAVITELFPKPAPSAAKSNLEFDEYDPTVAGLMKTLLTDRASSTPYRNSSMNLEPTFNMTGLWSLAAQITSSEDIHQSGAQGVDRIETACKEPTTTCSNFTDRKLCTITETSREYRSSSCSSASSASSADPLSCRRRF